MAAAKELQHDWEWKRQRVRMKQRDIQNLDRRAGAADAPSWSLVPAARRKRAGVILQTVDSSFIALS